ncbi:hypothetical protein WISP_139800 [Willisornis vidua]|uniref:Uncharacterized protein n=1 Tax=Willisornis vidua TaxID=1566151 RepID=A0ABQ9CMD2_9PASS|nr:hypothetical protein WISP_139800 [Willisornis vidua]
MKYGNLILSVQVGCELRCASWLEIELGGKKALKQKLCFHLGMAGGRSCAKKNKAGADDLYFACDIDMKVKRQSELMREAEDRQRNPYDSRSWSQVRSGNEPQPGGCCRDTVQAEISKIQIQEAALGVQHEEMVFGGSAEQLGDFDICWSPTVNVD